MFSVPARAGPRIRRRTSPASTKGPWTMTFTSSPPRLSTVRLPKSFERVCARTHTHARVHTHTLVCGLAPLLSSLSSFGRHPDTTGNDSAPRRLTSPSLSVSISRCVFQRLPPQPPLSSRLLPASPTLPTPTYPNLYPTHHSARFLLSALISPADTRAGKLTHSNT